MITLIGKKLGMTRVFSDNGKTTGVTVLEIGPCTIVQKKTDETDGYSALQIGFENIAERKLTMAEKGHFAKANVAPKRHLYENRLAGAESEKYSVGQELKVGEFFAEGDFIDVRGTSKGKGFAGVMKRHNFHGSHATHDHEYFRHGGSIGQKTYPGKVFKGMRMPGHMGDERVTVLNLQIVEVNAEKNLVVVAGAVPGARGSLVYLRPAIKKPKKS